MSDLLWLLRWALRVRCGICVWYADADWAAVIDELKEDHRQRLDDVEAFLLHGASGVGRTPLRALRNLSRTIQKAES